MGSLSTYARAGVGGFQGRKLAPGDALPLAREQAPPGEREQAWPALRLWQRTDPHHLGAAGRPFQRTRPPHLHRVRLPCLQGSRPHGHPLRGADDRARHSVDKGGADIISDGIGPGAIQVPGAGLPIVLLADRQTVGGYPKIATVASVDLPRLGRLLPGQTVRFAAVTVEEAEQLRRDQEARIQRALVGFTAARPPGGIDLVRLYEENLIDGVVYERDQAPR